MVCAFRIAAVSFPTVALIAGAVAIASAAAGAAEQLAPKQAALCIHLQNQVQSLDAALENYNGAWPERVV